MSDIDNDKPKLGTRAPLGLKRTVETGKVKQSFSHGRSNTVVVEVKRRRVLGRPGEEQQVEQAPPAPAAPTPAPGTAPAARSQVVPPRPATSNAGLSRHELQAKLLREAEEARMTAAEENRRRDDRIARETAETERQRVEEKARAAAEPKVEATPEPAPAPTPAPAPAPVAPLPPVPSPVIVPPAAPAPPSLPPRYLDFQLAPLRVALQDDRVLLDFDLGVGNGTDIPADDVRIATLLLTANAGQDEQIAAFLDREPGGGLESFALAPGDQRMVEATMTLPRHMLTVVTARERPFFVPIMVIDARYRWADGRESRTSAAFMVGQGLPNGRLSPVFLDRGDRVVERLEARLHGEVRRT